MGSKYKKIKKTSTAKSSNVTKKKKVLKKKKSKIKQPIQKDFLKFNYSFKNNGEKWLAVLLAESCVLLESYKLIEKDLEEIFGEDVVYFMPIYIDEKVPDFGIELYPDPRNIFVKCSDTVNENVFKKTDYLDKLLYIGSDPCTTTNKDINKLKIQTMKELEKRLPVKGSRVEATVGTFKNQEGIVKSVNKKKKTAIVEFHKRTRIVTAKLSVINFEKV